MLSITSILLIVFSMCVLHINCGIGSIEQVRIAHGHNSNSEMIVMWVSKSRESIVYVGKSELKLNMMVIGNSTNYSYIGKKFPKKYQSNELHYAYISGLKSNTRYYYTCGSKYERSEPFSFKTAPNVHREQPYLFTLIGDLGQTNYSQETINSVLNIKEDMSIIHVGDLSYADHDQPRWDRWGRMTEKLGSQTAWMVQPGNHEKEANIDGVKFIPYQHRFYMPSSESGVVKQDKNLYYSIDIASVHWIFLTSYTDYTVGSRQYQWFLNDLAKVDRSVTPWLIIAYHAPVYNSNKIHQKEAEAMRIIYEPVMNQNHVDLVISGHVHSYESCYRTVNYQRNETGAMYIVIGDSGNREKLYKNWQQPKPEWSRFRSGIAYGHGTLRVYNSSIAEWKWSMDTIVDDDDDSMIGDQFILESFYSKLGL